MSDDANSYEVNQGGGGLEICFSSSLVQIDQACDTVSRCLESMGQEVECHTFAINLVLREGLANAVRHGNKNDPDKVVKLCLSVTPGKLLEIWIEDQGRGFDWKAFFRSPKDDDADHGRGMAIMETYFDRYRYNETGNTLYLKKMIGPRLDCDDRSKS